MVLHSCLVGLFLSQVIEFEGRMRDLELDMTLCTATVDAVS